MAGKVDRVLDELILEHERKNEAANNLSRLISDAAGRKIIQKAGTDIPPGRSEIEYIAHSFELFKLGLQAHFFREETLLMEAFKESGNETLVAALNELMEEHNHIREQLEVDTRVVAGLLEESGTQPLWQERAEELHAHMRQTENILAIHAKREESLFKSLRELYRG